MNKILSLFVASAIVLAIVLAPESGSNVRAGSFVASPESGSNIQAPESGSN